MRVTPAARTSLACTNGETIIAHKIAKTSTEQTPHTLVKFRTNMTASGSETRGVKQFQTAISVWQKPFWMLEISIATDSGRIQRDIG
jgi:hypothetical protein